MNKSKLSKIGSIWENKDKEGKFYIKLGNLNNSDSKYNLHVEIVVKDDKGNVVVSKNDGFLTLVDPRSRDGFQQAVDRNPALGKLQFDILIADNE